MSKKEPGESSASLAHSNSAWSCSVKRQSGERGAGGGECVGGGGTEEQVVAVVSRRDGEGGRGFSFQKHP